VLIYNGDQVHHFYSTLLSSFCSFFHWFSLLVRACYFK
jgi:hypothetical protein